MANLQGGPNRNDALLPHGSSNNAVRDLPSSRNCLFFGCADYVGSLSVALVFIVDPDHVSVDANDRIESLLQRDVVQTEVNRSWCLLRIAWRPEGLEPPLHQSWLEIQLGSPPSNFWKIKQLVEYCPCLRPIRRLYFKT